MTETKGFEKLISYLPNNLSVLDVGCGGLEGENTSKYLLRHFGAPNITGVCREAKMVELFKAQLAEQGKSVPAILVTDFYTMPWETQYDLVVLDLTIDNNLEKDWTDEGLGSIQSLIKPKGYLINYIMMTEHYGNPEETPMKIAKHREDFWGVSEFSLEGVGKKLNTLKDFNVLGISLEERRPYILWTLLQRK